jgi:hypothetical protein
MSSRGHRLALGASAVVTVGLVSAFASAIGAQTASDPIVTEVVSVDDTGTLQELPDTLVAAISDTGSVVAYDTAAPDAQGRDGSVIDVSPDGRRVWVRDRLAGTSRPVAEDHSVAPGVSGDGCTVAYTVVAGGEATLTTVDRCATDADDPLPVGTVLDTVELEMVELDTVEPAPVRVAPPSLSADGSTIVWSTGREIRRYARPAAGEPHARTHAFDVADGGTADIVTGSQTDVSADGGTVVFVAGTGTAAFEPATANVYVWTSDAPLADPELISIASTGGPGLSDSTAPTISADGSFVVFESSDSGLAVVDSLPVTAPFVVGVDRSARTGQVLVDDATRPSVSNDGNHVVYQRGEAVRVLSSGATTGTIDHGIDELATADPSGAVAISQYGRWLVFAGTTAASATPAEPSGAPDLVAAVLAVDRASSNSDVVDTTTVPTTSATTVPATTATTAPPTSTESTVTVPDVVSVPTVPATTLVPTVIVPRFPTVTSRFPTVGLPRAPRRVVGTSRSTFDTDSTADRRLSVSASPVSFEPTVVEAGRRVAPVVLANGSSLPIEVAGASIDVPGAFAVVADNCTGTTIAPGSSCAVDVQFAPVSVGRVNAILTFRLVDGSLVRAALDGEGASEPTLALVPAVAGAGQTVTVFGAGFPSGATVELSRPGSSTPELIVVEVDGTFAHVVVVLPNTPVGSVLLEVPGQPDAFGDVAAELLVSSRGDTSSDAALRGGPGGMFGR